MSGWQKHINKHRRLSDGEGEAEDECWGVVVGENRETDYGEEKEARVLWRGEEDTIHGECYSLRVLACSKTRQTI